MSPQLCNKEPIAGNSWNGTSRTALQLLHRPVTHHSILLTLAAARSPSLSDRPRTPHSGRSPLPLPTSPYKGEVFIWAVRVEASDPLANVLGSIMLFKQPPVHVAEAPSSIQRVRPRNASTPPILPLQRGGITRLFQIILHSSAAGSFLPRETVS